MVLKSEKVMLRGGREINILPYTINAMERLTDSGALEALGGDNLKARYKAMRELVYEAIVDAGPDIDRDTVGDYVDAATFSTILDIIASVNGWKKNTPGEAQGSPN